MTKIKSEKAWFNGNIVDWENANVHLMTHALHYGTAWFEGIRCYKTVHGSRVFRLKEHVQRLFHSCKIYRTEIPFTEDEILDGILGIIRANRHQECYIRPIVFRGYGSMGVNPLGCPVEVCLLTWEWGKYLGEEAIEQGVDVCTSSWFRAAPNTFPSMAKAAGNYLNGGLVKMEAAVKGFAEGIALDVSGYVSEGSGENLLVVYQGKVLTPPLASSILAGITRNSVMTLLQEQGVEVVEQQIPRELLYVADELFLTGTAAEVTPVRSVDKIAVGSGKRGPVTQRLQEEFFRYVTGKREDTYDWLTPVYTAENVSNS
jgi:branched-chain amino acid aminotransferase